MTSASASEPVDRVRADQSTYWNIADIEFHCRISRSTAWRLVRRDGFPAPLIVSPRRVVWRRDEVVAFVEGRRDHAHYTGASTTGLTTRDAGRPFSTRPVRRRG